MKKLLLLSSFIILLLTGCSTNDRNGSISTPTTTPDVIESIESNPSNKGEISNIIGTYIETPTDKMPDDWRRKSDSSLSKLILNEDGTCTFIYNRCDDMVITDATYEIVDNQIILNNYDEYLTEHTYPENEVSFTIISNDEIYFNNEAGCIYGCDAYQKGYASFKRQ